MRLLFPSTSPRMKTRLLFLLASGFGLLFAAPATPPKPNIVFILADDLGWRDLATYGSPWHETPHLDRLAREGMRFTTAYASAPICSASRASILTGKSPARLQFEFVTKEPGVKVDARPLKTPPYPLNLALEEQTLAEVLAPAGYHTGFFGKWHVSQHNGYYLGWSTTHGPLQQGFAEGDLDFGGHSYSYRENKTIADQPLPAGEFPADSLTDRAVGFIRAQKDRPFFLYLSHYYVHTPIKARTAWLTEKYRAKLPAGADDGRAVYAGMVETLDHLVGRVMQALDEAGVADNTLLIFTSDNGGHPEYAANGPLRGSKWNVYEGGIRVPFIVRWPGRVAPGSVSDTPIIGSDLMPTLAAVAGTTPPVGVPMDGVNLLPVWGGATSVERQQPMVWHFPYYHPEGKFADAKPDIGINDFRTSQTRPQSAIRVGNYTLVHFYEDNRDEVYDLSKDLGEQEDISTQRPKKARKLRAQLDDYLKQVGARLPGQ
jgi:arylsulfatase A-like enzyme